MIFYYEYDKKGMPSPLVFTALNNAMFKTAVSEYTVLLKCIIATLEKISLHLSYTA